MVSENFISTPNPHWLFTYTLSPCVDVKHGPKQENKLLVFEKKIFRKI